MGFRPSTRTTLFCPDEKENLYKVVELDHQSNKMQIRYVDWGPNYDEWVCCRSVWVYSQFSSQLSTSNKIPHDIAALIDELNVLSNCETICKKKTLRFIPIKFRLRWPELLTAIIEG